jgi:hypothetical protein
MRTDGPWGFNEIMVAAAVRYCLGRRTYIVHSCADWLIGQWAGFSAHTRELVQRDIEEEFTQDDASRAEPTDNWIAGPVHPLGHDADRREWERVRALWSER